MCRSVCSPWFYDRFAGSAVLALMMAASVGSAWSLLGYGPAQPDLDSDSPQRLIAFLFNLGALAMVLACASLALVVSLRLHGERWLPSATARASRTDQLRFVDG